MKNKNGEEEIPIRNKSLMSAKSLSKEKIANFLSK